MRLSGGALRRTLPALVSCVPYFLISPLSHGAVFNPSPAAADGAVGSLREAIQIANGNADPENTFNLEAGTYLLTLANLAGQENQAATGDLDLTSSGKTYRFVGQGSDLTIIDGNFLDRVFHVFPTVNVQVRNLAIHFGNARDDGTAGGVPGQTASHGGGFLLENAVLATENVAIRFCGATGSFLVPATPIGAPGMPSFGGGIAAISSTILLGQGTLLQRSGADGARGGDASTILQIPGGPGGNAYGGGIWMSNGSLSLDGVRFSSTGAVGGFGGIGSLSSSFDAQPAGGAGGDGLGGGVFISNARLSVRGAVFEDNRAEGNGAGPAGPLSSPGETGGSGAGGAIWAADSSVEITTTVFRRNAAVAAHGGHGADGAPTFPPEEGGAGGEAHGGALHLETSFLKMERSTIGGNRTLGGVGGEGGRAGGLSPGDGGPGGASTGGGLHLVASTAELSAVSISDNVALGGEGGPAGPGFPFDGNGGAAGVASGGGISTGSTTLRLFQSTVFLNRAEGGPGGSSPRGTATDGGLGQGGGLYVLDGNVSVLDSTASGNQARGGSGGSGGQFGSGSAGDGGSGTGGGLFLVSGVELTSATIASNLAAGGPAGCCGNSVPGAGAGGGIGSSGSAVDGSSVLVADNTAATSPELLGEANFDHSLIEDPSGGIVVGSDNLLGMDPQLGALGNNGGPTLTHAITFASPAYNRGANPAGLAEDQRGPGFPRVRGGIADIGAFEAFPETPGVTVSVAPATTQEGGASLIFTFLRDDSALTPLSSALEVSFDVAGSAAFGTDYQQAGASGFSALAGEVVFPPNSSEHSLAITPLSDSTIEGDEIVTLGLAERPEYVIGEPRSATAVILDRPLTLLEIPTLGQVGRVALIALLALGGLLAIRMK